jgi:hypothetical protein
MHGRAGCIATIRVEIQVLNFSGWQEIFFLISNFRRVLYVLCFLMGNSPASELYMPTFRNTLFHLHRQVDVEWLGLRNVGVFIREKVCHPPSYWIRLFSSQTVSRINTPTFLNLIHSTPTCLWIWNSQSVPKRRHIKFKRRGITQKKA